MSGLAGRTALVKVSGAATAFTNEATTDAGDHATYQITSATKRVWDRTSSVVVKIAGVVVDSAGADPFSINRLTGKVIFVGVDAGRGAVTVTGDYLPMSVAAGARSYTFELSAGIVDNSDFDETATQNGFRQKLQGLLDFKGSIGKRWRTDYYFRTALLAGAPVVVEFFSDRTAAFDFAAWCLLEKRGLQAAVEGSVDVDVTFNGTADADGRVISAP